MIKYDSSYINKKFNKLTALGFSRKTKKKLYWYFKCECGKIKEMPAYNVFNHKVISCGCYNKELNIKNKTKHSMSHTKFYECWNAILDRCIGKNSHKFISYRKKDIKVCDSWLDFINFYNDMHESYLEHVKLHGEKNTTIDRIDNNKGYSRNNCRWATVETQLSNRNIFRKCLAISPNGEEIYFYNQQKFCKEYNISRSILCHCISGRQKHYKGWVFKYIDNNKYINKDYFNGN